MLGSQTTLYNMKECGCVSKKESGRVVRQEYLGPFHSSMTFEVTKNRNYIYVTSGMGKVKKAESAHEILANNLPLGP